MNSIITARNLSIGYGGKVILNDINLDIEEGVITTIIGPNGSGKSTLLKTLSGIIPRISGIIKYDNKELNDYSEKEKARMISVMMTGASDTEFMTVYEVVALGRYPYTGRLGLLTKEDEDIIDDAMTTVGITELRSMDFMKLSDGQRQRVMLARAICQRPRILIMDEPTTYLDISYKLELLSNLKSLTSNGLTVLMSVHDLELAKRISDRVICMTKESLLVEDKGKVFCDEYILNLFNVNMEHFKNIYKGDTFI